MHDLRSKLKIKKGHFSTSLLVSNLKLKKFESVLKTFKLRFKN